MPLTNTNTVPVSPGGRREKVSWKLIKEMLIIPIFKIRKYYIIWQLSCTGDQNQSYYDRKEAVMCCDGLDFLILIKDNKVRFISFLPNLFQFLL